MDFLIQLVEDYVATDRSHAKIQSGNALNRIARYVQEYRSSLPATSQHSRVFRTPSRVANGETTNTIADPPGLSIRALTPLFPVSSRGWIVSIVRVAQCSVSHFSKRSEHRE